MPIEMILADTLVFDSHGLWPVALAAGIVSFAAIAWLYPAQLRGAGLWGWTVPLFRGMAVSLVAVSLLKPVVLRPKTVEQRGALVFLVDCSRSMGVIDSGRSHAEQVALAAALGRLHPQQRSRVAASLVAEIDQAEAIAREVGSAISDLDYARVTGREVAEKENHLHEQTSRFTQAARALAARASEFPTASDLSRELRDLSAVSPDDGREGWAEQMKTRINKLRSAAVAFGSQADEELYKSDASVRQICEQVSRLSRLDLAEAALLRPDEGVIARQHSESPNIGMTIGAGLLPVALENRGRPVASLPVEATANGSDLTGAVSAALNGLGKQPLRAVVLLSDGRQVGGRADLAAGLRPSGVPVFTVGVAAANAPDVSISKVTLSTSSAFAGEMVEGEADVTVSGAVNPPAELQLTTSAGQQSLKLTPSAGRDQHPGRRLLNARFLARVSDSNASGAEHLVLNVPPVKGEVTTANNRVERWVKVSADKLKVAVVTAAPSWDFLYLRNGLVRRPWVSLESQVMDPAHPRLSMTAAQILQQDVIILSDVPPTALNVNQWDAIHSLLTDRGGSVILVAGSSFPIGDYQKQPIARSLLPFDDVRPAWKQWPGEQPAFHFVPTAAGQRELLRLPGVAENPARMWQDLPAVFRYLNIPEKDFYPDVQKLLVEADTQTPVLTERRLGAGRVFLLGLNETWRWRLKRPEREADQFWRQLIRYAGGEPYAASDGNYALDLDRISTMPGQPVHVRARIRSGRLPSTAALLCPIHILQNGKERFARTLASTGGGHFAGQFADLPPGDYQIQLRGVATSGAAADVRVPLHVADSDEAEMRDISGDPALLTRIARSSGGQYLPIEDVDRLPALLDALRETESQFVREPLWNSPWLFTFVIACFAGEWALRKRMGLA
jgi:hypothetical protein